MILIASYPSFILDKEIVTDGILKLDITRIRKKPKIQYNDEHSHVQSVHVNRFDQISV